MIVAASLVAVGVCPAYSQGAAPPRPSGGLFGATRSDVAGADKLNFTFQVAQGFDSAMPPDVASRLSRGLESGGFSTLMQASSRYNRSGRSFSLGGSASTAFKYFRDLDRLDALGHSAGIGATVRVPKGNLQLQQIASYSPSYLYQLFPFESAPELDASIPTNPEYQIVDTPSLSYRTTTTLSLGSARGTQFTASGAFSRTDFDERALNRLDLEYYEGGMKVSRRMASSSRFNVGYDYRNGEFGFGGPSREHRLTFGVEYSPALSRTRRAVFRLDVSPTRLELPASALSASPTGEGDTLLHRLSSEASISYPFRPNWRTAARYRRSVEYLAVLGQPVLSDGGRLELTGLLARPIDLSASAGYVTAASALNPAQSLVTYTGQVAIRYALKRSLALSSEYLYYYYDMREQAALAPHLPPRFEQHGVRVGVVLFLEPLGR